MEHKMAAMVKADKGQGLSNDLWLPLYPDVEYPHFKYKLFCEGSVLPNVVIRRRVVIKSDADCDDHVEGAVYGK